MMCVNSLALFSTLPPYSSCPFVKERREKRMEHMAAARIYLYSIEPCLFGHEIAVIDEFLPRHLSQTSAIDFNA